MQTSRELQYSLAQSNIGSVNSTLFSLAPRPIHSPCNWLRN